MKCLFCKKELGDIVYKAGESIIVYTGDYYNKPSQQLGIVQPYCRKCIKLISKAIAKEMNDIINGDYF